MYDTFDSRSFYFALERRSVASSMRSLLQRDPNISLDEVYDRLVKKHFDSYPRATSAERAIHAQAVAAYEANKVSDPNWHKTVKGMIKERYEDARSVLGIGQIEGSGAPATDIERNTAAAQVTGPRKPQTHNDFEFGRYRAFANTFSVSMARQGFEPNAVDIEAAYLRQFPQHDAGLKAHQAANPKLHAEMLGGITTLQENIQDDRIEAKKKEPVATRHDPLAHDTPHNASGRTRPRFNSGGAAQIGALNAVAVVGVGVATGMHAKDIALETGKAIAEMVPGVNILTAPNADEARVRSNVAVAVTGSTIAGAVVGAGVGGAISGLVGYAVSDEIARGYARYVQGKKDTVAPSAGEQALTGAATAAMRAYAAVKETLVNPVQHAPEGAARIVAAAKPPSSLMR